MNLQQIFINIFESKSFISFISIFLGIFAYWFYLYIEELKINMILVMNYVN